jgi:hypothetical protein
VREAGLLGAGRLATPRRSRRPDDSSLRNFTPADSKARRRAARHDARVASECPSNLQLEGRLSTWKSWPLLSLPVVGGSFGFCGCIHARMDSRRQAAPPDAQLACVRRSDPGGEMQFIATNAMLPLNWFLDRPHTRVVARGTAVRRSRLTARSHTARPAGEGGQA